MIYAVLKWILHSMYVAARIIHIIVHLILFGGFFLFNTVMHLSVMRLSFRSFDFLVFVTLVHAGGTSCCGRGRSGGLQPDGKQHHTDLHHRNHGRRTHRRRRFRFVLRVFGKSARYVSISDLWEPVEPRVHRPVLLALFVARIFVFWLIVGFFRFDAALLQNEVANVYENDFANLADEDMVWGSKNDDNLSEYHSFTHHLYSKGKRVRAIDWQPQTKGVVAVAITERWGLEQRIRASGLWRPGSILIWNFSDTINPQFLLEAPNDVLCFRFHPLNPNIVAAGCVNGQVRTLSSPLCRVGAFPLRFLCSFCLVITHTIIVFDTNRLFCGT